MATFVHTSDRRSFHFREKYGEPSPNKATIIDIDVFISHYCPVGRGFNVAFGGEENMPAIIVLAILLGVGLTVATLMLMFFSVAFESIPAKPDPELTEEQARAWFRRVSNNRIDPSDSGSPTFGELLRRASLEDLREATSRSTVL